MEDVPALHQYAALSYCWGNPALVERITLNGKAFSVTQNLSEFLCQLVHSRYVANASLWSGAWWIDAICLNQNDVEEKSAQVACMWRIFSQANFVCAWLGPEQPDTKLCFDGLRRMRHCEVLIRNEYLELYEAIDAEPATKEEILSYLPAEITHAISKLSHNGYWNRVWVVQEIMWARDPIVMCGGHTALLQDLIVFFEIERAEILTGDRSDRPVFDLDKSPYAYLPRPDDAPPYLPIRLLSEHCWDFLAQYQSSEWRLRLEPSESKRGVEIRQAIVNNSRRKCSDERDMIYATLSLPNILQHDCARLKADYSLSASETAAYTIEYLDHILNTSDLGLGTHGAPFGASVLGLILSLLDLAEDEFRAWMQKIACWDEMQQTWFLPAAAGRKLGCGGFSLHHLLHHSLISFQSSTCSDVSRKDCDTANCMYCRSEQEDAFSEEIKLELGWKTD